MRATTGGAAHRHKGARRGEHDRHDQRRAKNE